LTPIKPGATELSVMLNYYILGIVFYEKVIERIRVNLPSASCPVPKMPNNRRYPMELLLETTALLVALVNLILAIRLELFIRSK
jgi:hypothetical protein